MTTVILLDDDNRKFTGNTFHRNFTKASRACKTAAASYYNSTRSLEVAIRSYRLTATNYKTMISSSTFMSSIKAGTSAISPKCTSLVCGEIRIDVMCPRLQATDYVLGGVKALLAEKLDSAL